jgi:hypothetical protein
MQVKIASVNYRWFLVPRKMAQLGRFYLLSLQDRRWPVCAF